VFQFSEQCRSSVRLGGNFLGCEISVDCDLQKFKISSMFLPNIFFLFCFEGIKRLIRYCFLNKSVKTRTGDWCGVVMSLGSIGKEIRTNVPCFYTFLTVVQQRITEGK